VQRCAPALSRVRWKSSAEEERKLTGGEGRCGLGGALKTFNEKAEGRARLEKEPLQQRREKTFGGTAQNPVLPVSSDVAEKDFKGGTAHRPKRRGENDRDPTREKNHSIHPSSIGKQTTIQERLERPRKKNEPGGGGNRLDRHRSRKRVLLSGEKGLFPYQNGERGSQRQGGGEPST